MAKRSFGRSFQNGNPFAEHSQGKEVRQEPAHTLAGQIRQHRLKCGFEQRDLAARIGITANAISNWETGRARPDIHLLPIICDALGISLYELFGQQGPNASLTSDEMDIIQKYRELTSGNKLVVSTLADTLRQVQAVEQRRPILRLINCDHALAAGVGDPSEFKDEGKPIFVYDSALTARADYVFHVNGDSMEPDYPNGAMVLVERISNGKHLNYGEVGAFMIGNETYIKVYQADGLHSLNRQYQTMRFHEDERVFLIGRVLGILDESEVAAQENLR